MIGMESMVLPGVTIGEGAIIGAAALVSKDVPDWVMAVGAPAKVVTQIPPMNSDYMVVYLFILRISSVEILNRFKESCINM